MKSPHNNSYQTNNYKQWVSLPPQIPIPYNESYLHFFSLQIFKIEYLNAILTNNQKKNSPSSQPTNENDEPIDQFKLRTFWWGQQSGYQSLLKTLTISEQSKNAQVKNKLEQNEILIQSGQKNKNKIAYQPLKFLVCCPFQNFLKYCIDMRVLKIQLIYAQQNSIIAKTYLNFLTLNNCWKGEPIQLNLPLFALSFNMQSFSGAKGSNNPKIIGEMKLQIALQKIANPYKMIPQTSNQGRGRLNTRSIEERKQENKKQVLKQNEQNISILKRQLNIQGKRQGNSSMSSFSQKSGFLVGQVEQSQKKQTASPHLINYSNFEQMGNNRRNKKATISTERQVNIGQHKAQYKGVEIPRHNYESEKIQLEQDFRMIFGIRNPLYESFFASGKDRQLQTIELSVKVSQNKEGKWPTDYNFEKVNVFIPFIQKGQAKQKCNQYKLCQQSGIIKLQFDTSTLSAQQISKFIKQTIVRVQIFYAQLTIKQTQNNQRPTKNVSLTKQARQSLVLKGSISFLQLLANCGLPNPISLTSDKKSSNISQCLITAIPQPSQVKIQETKSQLEKLQSQRIIQRPKAKQELIWLKIDKFIPLNHKHFTQTNIYVRINLIEVPLKPTPTKDQLKGLQNQIQVSLITQTKTLWRPFAEVNRLFAKFQNQHITFPVSLSSESKDTFIKLQIWNRQKQNYKIGECLFPLQSGKGGGKQVRGRTQLQVKDIKSQTIGFMQLWYDKGDINYINNLIGAHINQRPGKLQSELIELSQSKKLQDKANNEAKQIKEESSQAVQQYSAEQESIQESVNSVDQQKRNDEDQQKDGLSFQGQFVRLEQNLNKCGNLLQIHNELFFTLFLAYHRSQKQQNPFQQFATVSYPNRNATLYISSSQLYSFVLTYLSKSNRHTNLNRLIQKHRPQNQSWINLLNAFYQNDSPNISNRTINFTQLSNSFEAFQTYYHQIIQQKDEIFKRVKHILNSASIDPKQIEDTMIDEFQKRNQTTKKQIFFIRTAKDKITQRILRSSRASEDNILQCQTVLQNFLFFYSQRSSNISNKFEAINLTEQICDELRKFDLYDTTFESKIETQSFRSFISRNIKQILDINYFLKAQQLIHLVRLNQIELTRWEMLHFTDPNKSKMAKAVSTDKIIVKSPTFGLLQHVNSNQKEVRNDRLFKTSPLELNSSIVEGMRNIGYGFLEISQAICNEQRKQSQNSYILKKRIEMISPISNNLDINAQIVSAINPSSVFFGKNEKSENRHKEKGQCGQIVLKGNHQGMEISRNSEELSSESLVGLFVDLSKKISWIRVGKRTYFPQQGSVISDKRYQISLDDHSKLNFQRQSFLNAASGSNQGLGLDQQSRSNQSNRQVSNFTQNLNSSSKVSTLINLFGLQKMNDYNLVVGLAPQQNQPTTEDVLINCKHARWENLIDSSGNYFACFIICLHSQLHSLSSHLNNQ